MKGYYNHHHLLYRGEGDLRQRPLGPLGGRTIIYNKLVLKIYLFRNYNDHTLSDVVNTY